MKEALFFFKNKNLLNFRIQSNCVYTETNGLSAERQVYIKNKKNKVFNLIGWEKCCKNNLKCFTVAVHFNAPSMMKSLHKGNPITSRPKG